MGVHIRQFIFFNLLQRPQELANMKGNLNSAQDGEAREEAHCTSDESKCSLRRHLFILFYVVVGRCAQVDVHQLHAVGHLGLWGMKLKIEN